MIITLTTDWGLKDHYAGMMKGEILKVIPDANIVDITHDIEAFNIMHAGFVLKNAYRHFPPATIHIAAVNTQESGVPVLLIEHEGNFFIGPDNGLFGLLFDPENIPAKMFRVKTSYTGSFIVSELLPKILSQMNDNKLDESLFEKISTFRMASLLQPMASENHIRAAIIYFDRFGNAIVNISKSEFEKIQSGRKFIFHFKRYDDVDIVSENYGSVTEGEKLCLFNSSGYLEIAINKGNAQSLLNLAYGDIVQIEFL